MERKEAIRGAYRMTGGSGLFDTVNQKVGEVAGEVGATPQGWNAGIFNMIRSLSETVIIPIAGAILAFVMTYELIQMVTEKNNMHDIDTFMFFKWVFKTFAAVLIVTNTWNIVMGIFDMAQQVVNQSAGVIIGNTSIDLATVVPSLEAQLDTMELGGLLGLWFQSLFVGLTMNVLSICIMLVIYGRMIQIYLVTSLGPIPLSTMANGEWRSMGQVAYVNVPKDLTKVKSKVLFNLTKRQLICFAVAALMGVPLFFLLKGSTGTTVAALVMILAMMPGFLFGVYEKNGQPLEVIGRHIVESCFLRPKERPYMTSNAYEALIRQAKPSFAPFSYVTAP